MKTCFRCGAEISDEEEYCKPCTYIRAVITRNQKESELRLTILGIFVLTAAILTVFHAATYMTPRDFIINIGGGTLFVLVSSWVMTRLPSIFGP